MNKILLIILLLLLSYNAMAKTRLENIIEIGTRNYSSKPNPQFIDALYLEFHNRKATPNEIKYFKNSTIQNTSNIIAGRQIIIPPTSKKPVIVEKQIKDNIKRYKNIINIYGTPTDEQRAIINDYGTRIKLKEPINVGVGLQIPDEYINSVDKGKQDWIKNQKNTTSIAATYNWPNNQIFINSAFPSSFEKNYTHELGHAVDDQYGISKNEFPNYFGETLEDENNTNLADPNFQLENTANHIRKYMQIPDEYIKKYPENSKYLDSVLKIPDEAINSKNP